MPKGHVELDSALLDGIPSLDRCGELCGTNPPHPEGGKMFREFTNEKRKNIKIK